MQTVSNCDIVVFFHFMLHYVCILLLLASLSFKLRLVNFNKQTYCIVLHQRITAANINCHVLLSYLLSFPVHRSLVPIQLSLVLPPTAAAPQANPSHFNLQISFNSHT